jgi:hypothetical protein
MPSYTPPASPPAVPETFRIPIGTRLVRIHLRQYGGTTFNPTVPANQFAGGRFDSIRAGNPFLYAGLDIEAAVCEVLLRDVPAAPAPRRIPLAKLDRRQVSFLKTVQPLDVVKLMGTGLSAIGQDPWITSCEANEYHRTRAWADAIRGWMPQAPGLVWRSRRNQEHMSCVLYAPTCPATALRVTTGFPADTGRGRSLIEAVLNRHYITLGAA